MGVFRAGAAALALTVLCVGSAQASDDEIIALYEQSTQAWADGRFEDADRAMEAAWRQAEDEWGPSDDLAMLAASLADQRLAQGKRAAAQEPAARVLALTEEGSAPSIPQAEARLMLARARLAGDPPSSASIAQLASVLRSVEQSGALPAADIRLGLLELAQAHQALGEWDAVYDVATHTLDIMDGAPRDVSDNERGTAAVLAGSAAMQTARYDIASSAFLRAMRNVDRTSKDTSGRAVVNPTWALLGAWSAMAAATEATRTGDMTFTPAGLPPEGSGCRPDWVERDKPVYPVSAYGRSNTRLSPSAMQIGATVVGYYFAADGTTTEVETLAAVPDKRNPFVASAANTVKRWRAEPASVADCLGEPQTNTFQYMVDYDQTR